MQALKLPVVLDGNLKLGSRQYHVGQKTASLLKKYCEEALKHLEINKNQLNWLARDIYFETQDIVKQLDRIMWK